MDAYYINLDNAEDRNLEIVKQINNANLNFHLKRFPAVEGKLHHSTRPPELSNAQWGCWLSHLCIQQLSLQNSDNLLVLEDDSFFNSSINLVSNIQLDAQWDVIYLDATFVEIEDYLYITRELHKINSLDLNHAVIKLPSDVNCYGTIGYLINKNSKLKIFNLLFNRSTLGLPIDNILCSLNQAHLINSYILLPTLLYPFPDSFNSHSVSGNHPLADDWVNFRKLISMHKSTSESIEKELTKIITNRLKFSIYNKFNPINKLV